MKKLAESILANRQELAQLDAMSMGRPVSSHFDAFACAGNFEHYAQAGLTALGTTSLNTPGFVNMSFRQPIGPVAAIIPWNAPVVRFSLLKYCFGVRASRADGDYAF